MKPKAPYIFWGGSTAGANLLLFYPVLLESCYRVPISSPTNASLSCEASYEHIFRDGYQGNSPSPHTWGFTITMLQTTR